MITHDAQTILGDIPSDWGTFTLRHVLADHQSGDWGAEREEKELRVLRSTNFTDDGNLDFSDVAIRCFPEVSTARYSLKAGDLLLERSGGGPTQPVGRIAFVEEDLDGFGFTNFVQRLRPDKEQVNPEYLGWTLFYLNKSGIVERLQHQTTQMRNLEYRDYLRVTLPKPPEEEQRRIAAAIQDVHESVQLTQAELVAARRLKTALMQQLFTKGIPGRHKKFVEMKRGLRPASWQVFPLSRLADVDAGVTLNQDRAARSNGFRYLTVVNVQRDTIDLSEARTLELWPSEVPAKLLRERDILVVEGHANGAEIGRAAMVDADSAGMTFQNHLFRVRVTADNMQPEFLLHMLNSERIRRHWNAVCNTSSGLNTINRRMLRRVEIPLPDPSEQRDILALIEGANKNIGACDSKLTALLRLKKSLLQNLLTGKVRVATGGGA